jgi:serine/threonine protein phosphatase PrpC
MHSAVQVVTVDLAAERAFGLVLCSDGVTDELKPRDIAERVANAGPAEDGAKLLVQDSQDFCMDRSKVDDCTAVVIHFNL